MKRVERVRLYPTPRQRDRLHFSLDVTRELYNALLQERGDAWRMRGVTVSSKMQYREITQLRKRATWIDSRLGAVYRECEDAVLHRLDLAFQAFFRRVKAGQTPGFPRYKPASRWHQLEYPHGDRALRFDGTSTKVSVPGLGRIRVRKGREVPKTYGRAWIVERNDSWYACFECEREIKPLPPAGRQVGIDRGVHVLAATSEGVLYDNPAHAEVNRRRIARHQRALEAVTIRDGGRRVCNRVDPKRLAAVRRLSRAKEREANRRRDTLHKLSRRIVNGFDVIALEALNLRSMTRSARGKVQNPGRNVAAKAGLNRRLLDAGFGLLRQMIVAKAEEAARTVVEVDARFSSQTCSRCEQVCAGSRRRRRFCCVSCGFAVHADVNAALEILRRAQLALLRKPQAGAESATQPDAA